MTNLKHYPKCWLNFSQELCNKTDPAVLKNIVYSLKFEGARLLWKYSGTTRTACQHDDTVS